MAPNLQHRRLEHQDARPWARDRHLGDLLHAYLTAKMHVLAAGFEHELVWQEEAMLDNVTPTIFLRECAWVVLNSGMRESVVRSLFGNFSRAFGYWCSSEWISSNAAACREHALRIFAHKGKVEAVITTAKVIEESGLDSVLADLRKDGPATLMRFPYIGEVTSMHLAKNLGVPVAKPDRHVARVARQCGYTSVDALCREVSDLIDEHISVVDIVIWRYATLCDNYLDTFNVSPRRA